MSDYAIRVTAANGQLRGFAALTTGLVGELQRRHHTWPVASAALGRTVTVGAMMGLMLKSEQDRLTIQIKGDGPLGQIVVDADGLMSVGWVGIDQVHAAVRHSGPRDHEVARDDAHVPQVGGREHGQLLPALPPQDGLRGLGQARSPREHLASQFR